MPKLVLTKEGHVVREFIITKQDTVIGRTNDCDLAFADESVSRHHLRIICILGDCFLEDMNSANGTLVNNRLTNKCPLEDGDTISIGKHKIEYDATQYPTASSEEFDTTRIELIKQLGKLDSNATIITHNSEQTVDQPSAIQQLDSTPTTTQSDQSDTNYHKQLEPGPVTNSRTKAENPKTRTGKLKIVSGSHEGHNMSLHKSVTGIDKAGQRVAAITRRPDGYFLVPLDEDASDNIKVMINGSVITRKIYPLWSNDIIELSGTEMEFLFED